MQPHRIKVQCWRRASLSDSDIYAALTEIFNEVFLRSDMKLTPELTAQDVPGWDSFKQVEILIATEERFGVRLQTREIDKLKNVGDFVTVLTHKIRTIA